MDQRRLKELEKAAKQAMKMAYSPYSNIKVGAAVLCSDGTIYSGCNIENSSYSLTICAERVAASKAVSSGSKKIRSIVITSNLDGFIYPCGACRQFLSEFGNNIDVVLLSSTGRIKKYKLSELLPYVFRLEPKPS
ncbi:MAG: cytidine deaminase [Conexivisphaerales archaeon]